MTDADRLARRLRDVAIVLALAPIALPVCVGISLIVLATSGAPVLHWSRRVGADGRVFRMPKFRTMRRGTPEVAPALLTDRERRLTRPGGFLRRHALDELPQLLSVLVGDMSLVGPRPALVSEHDLLAARAAVGLDTLAPGITGWAQVNGRDRISLTTKVALEADYRATASWRLDFHILRRTLACWLRQEWGAA